MSDLKVGSGPGSESKFFASSFSPWSLVWRIFPEFFAQKWLMEWKASLCWLVLKNVETRGFVFLEGWAGSVLWCFMEWHFKSKVALGLDQTTFWYLLYNPSSNLVWSRTGLDFCGETGKKDAWPAVAGRWSHFSLSLVYMFHAILRQNPRDNHESSEGLLRFLGMGWACFFSWSLCLPIWHWFHHLLTDIISLKIPQEVCFSKGNSNW